MNYNKNIKERSLFDTLFFATLAIMVLLCSVALFFLVDFFPLRALSLFMAWVAVLLFDFGLPGKPHITLPCWLFRSSEEPSSLGETMRLLVLLATISCVMLAGVLFFVFSRYNILT